MEPIARRLESAIATSRKLYNRLVLLAGASATRRSDILMDMSKKTGLPFLNVGLSFSQRLLGIPPHRRPLEVNDIFAEMLPENELLLLDRIEFLFEPSLETDPLKLLQHYSRNRVLVVSWPGQMNDDGLVYGNLGHPEHKVYPPKDFIGVSCAQ